MLALERGKVVSEASRFEAALFFSRSSFCFFLALYVLLYWAFMAFCSSSVFGALRLVSVFCVVFGGALTGVGATSPFGAWVAMAGCVIARGEDALGMPNCFPSLGICLIGCTPLYQSNDFCDIFLQASF